MQPFKWSRDTSVHPLPAIHQPVPTNCKKQPELIQNDCIRSQKPCAAQDLGGTAPHSCPKGPDYYGRKGRSNFPWWTYVEGRRRGRGEKMKEKNRPGRMRAKDDEQWSLLSMERRTELRAPEVTGHTDPRRPLPGITKNNLN